ncbi:Protein bric-a-brac 2 [Biomphalaria pfeifferi]|uniref:Protein bric-a-brac 2 n=1 Tax=Biomphalaria pfeifferi TaxID=112525 RepID=A0AAD8C480_BIOPF|nr:Protein bric-a-brac 2 [Biomphalaria pfeifferi]
MAGKIMSTLTELQSTIQQLSVLFEKELLELNCHLHPLEGIAHEARKALSWLNSAIPRAVFGSDCRAANLLYAISKLRYKAKGDPSGFKQFLKNHSLPSSTFPRYVSNRLHVLFCSAGLVFRHRQLLISYLEKTCRSNGMRIAVLLDMMAKVQNAISFIRGVIAEPDFVQLAEHDAFGRPLMQHDETLIALRIVDHVNIEQLNEVINIVANATLTVILRQYERYIDGDLSSLTNESMQAASSAPAQNIWAERTLGLFDAMARKAPNAEITYLDGKAKAKVNKSLNWFYSKSITEQDNIVKFYIARANTLRSLAKTRRDNYFEASGKWTEERHG